MDRSALGRVLRSSAFWVLVVFLALVVAEMYLLADGKRAVPYAFTRSIFYPVLLAILSYVLVFRKSDHYENFKAFLTAFSFGVVGASLFLMSRRPTMFDSLAEEDGFIENLSAAALLVGAAVFVAIAVMRLLRRNFFVAGVAVLFGIVLFVIGMEEISWMQRVLNFETSDFFLERNIQNEANLHNLNTGVSEKMFYFGGFLTLILLPFFHGPLSAFLRDHERPELGMLLPESWVLVPSSLMVGYVGTSIEGDPTQGIASMVTVFLLFRLGVTSLRAGNLPKFMIYSAFLALVCLMLYYFSTYDYSKVDIRSWARKEYLELIIALGLLGWAVSALSQTLKARSARATIAA